jgi:DNA-binding LytR/AlgR family response regulator
MNKLRSLVVDDDAMSRALIEHFIRQHDALEYVGSCESAVDAANKLRAGGQDLVFLDVEMPQMSGLDLLKSLNVRPQVILVTSKKEYALEAFDVDVTDYLLKPPSYGRFIQAVERAQRRAEPEPAAAPPPKENGEEARSDQDDHVFVKTGGRLVKLNLAELLYVEAQGDYMLLHTPSDKYLVHSTMKAMAERLPESDFVRVHRSYVVRLDQIKDIEDRSLVIGRAVIPIGATHKDKLMERLNLI